MNFIRISHHNDLAAPACEPTYITQGRTEHAPLGSVTVQKLHSLGAEDPAPTIIDVREAIEFAGGRVPGSKPLPMSELTSRHEELRAHTGPIYLICQTGSRSETCRAWLAERGHDVVNVAGGTSAWRRAGFALEG